MNRAFQQVNRTQPIRRSCGFTLVELLVVVAIITVLIAILLPSLQRARYATRVAVCASNLRQITIAATTYASDHGGLYPNGPSVSGKNWPVGVDKAMRQQLQAAHPAVLGEYVGGSVSPAANKLMRCPQIMAEGQGALYKGLSDAQYMLHFNASAALRSGSSVVPNTAGWYGLPNRHIEAMPRINSSRIQNANFRSGGGVWESSVLASDIAFLRVTSQWRIGSGHMRNGTYDNIGNAQLQQASPDAIATANYAFQDGSIDNYTFDIASVNTDMVYIDDGTGGGAAGYLLPRDRSDQIE